MPEPVLKACPFCGEPGAYRKAGQPWASRGWAAGCPDGHAESPDMGTQEEAARWWNRRNRPRKATTTEGGEA